MIAYFEKEIIKIMSESDARGNWYKLGLGKDIKQFDNATKTLINLLDEDKFIYKDHPYVKILTIEEANQKIDELHNDEYILSNEFLMNANLMQKVNNNEIDLNEMQNTWTQQEELQWLYEKGISGIQIKRKVSKYE